MSRPTGKPTDAWLRGGAGPMRDRRAERGGARNESAELIEEAAEEKDPYRGCPVYEEHGACSCSTGVPGNTCLRDD